MKYNSLKVSKKSRAPLVPNKKTAAYLRRVLKDADEGKNMVGPFTSNEEMDKYLNSLV